MLSAGAESLLHQARSADLGSGPEAGEERGGGGHAAGSSHRVAPGPGLEAACRECEASAGLALSAQVAPSLSPSQSKT